MPHFDAELGLCYLTIPNSFQKNALMATRGHVIGYRLPQIMMFGSEQAHATQVDEQQHEDRGYVQNQQPDNR